MLVFCGGGVLLTLLKDDNRRGLASKRHFQGLNKIPSASLSKFGTAERSVAVLGALKMLESLFRGSVVGNRSS